MRKLIWTLVILVVVGVFGGRAWYLHKQSTTEKDVVKIGALVPLTGPTARDGADALAGMKIALDEINNDSQYDFKLDLLVEDSKYMGPATISAFHRINGNTPAFIVFGTVPTVAVSPLLDTYHKPILSLVNADDDSIFSSEQIFRMWTSVSQKAVAVADFINREYPGKTVALLGIKSVDGDLFKKNFTEVLHKQNQLLTVERFNIDDIETRNQVIKLMDKKPDIIVVHGYAQGYIAALNSLREYGFDGVIITNADVIMNKELVANNANGMYFEYPDYDFTKLIQKEPRLMDNLFAAFGYESVKVLAKVIKDNGKTSEQIRLGLANLNNFDSGFGKMGFTDKGEISLPKPVIKQMQADGTAKVVKE